MGLPRIAAQWLVKRTLHTTPARYSGSSSGGGIDKGTLLNIIGLPALAAVLFGCLSTYSPSEIQPIQYYYDQYREEQKKKGQ